MSDEMANEILHPKNWKAAKGYSNGIAATGRMVFTSGVVGWNDQQEFETDDFGAQVAQCLKSTKEILAEAGAAPKHLTRLTWYVTSKTEYLASLRDIGAAYREHFGRNFPAMALVQVVALVEDRAKVEIEATAVIPQA